LSLSEFIARRRFALAAGALIVCGVALRLALVLIGWPHGNSEEGTMGIEALHILLRGEHPIYLYGQNYMGVGEAYVGALAFRLFGASTAALRLGMLVCYAGFLVGVCWLAALLYSRRVALLSLVVLILGTPFLVKIELLADGGKAETMALGALSFALAAWLALAQPEAGGQPGQRRALRYAGYFAWGALTGFGLYTYTIFAPFALTTGLLLWLTSRRELRGWALALPLAGLLLGLAPDILYTLTTPLSQNPIAVFWSLHQSLNTGGVSGPALLLKQLDGALLYTLPTVTGLANFYPVEALPGYGLPGWGMLAAVVIGGGWSLGYLALLVVATARPLRAMGIRWATLRQPRKLWSLATNQPHARSLARLLLALSAWLTIAAYALSATAANNPHSGRYMIGLLVVTPALLWPLVERAERVQGAQDGGRWPGRAGRLGALALLGACLLIGAVSLAQTIPDEVAADGRDTQLIHALEDNGVTRFYASYWTCDLLNFETRERLTCAVVNDDARPGLTRYRPYAVAVRADPHAPYLLSPGSELERAFLTAAAASHQRYSMRPLDGYHMYIPMSG
jgi:hypothetical protein